MTYGNKKCKKKTTSQCACSSYGTGYVDSSSCTAACSGNSTVTCGTEVTYGTKKCKLKTVSACESGKYCSNNACSNCPSYTAKDTSKCITTPNGSADVCGHQNYKYTCTSGQYCNSGTCTNCTTTYSTSDLWYVSGTTPSGCYVRAGGSDSVSCGGATYYKYKLVASGCVTAANRSNCYNYTSVTAADGVTYYYNASKMATDATTTKPSVTNTDCHTYSYAAPSQNGNGTKCYYNIVSVSPTTSQSCTLTTTDSSGCTDTVQNCGTCGYQTRTGSRSGSRTGTQTRTATCNSDGTGFSYSDWGTCTSSAAWTYGDCSYNGWRDCIEATKTLSQTISCTLTTKDSTACTKTVTNDGCTCGYKTRTGSRKGTKSGTQAQTRTTKTCEGSGSRRYWTYNAWTNSGSCTSSEKDWTYGDCTYTDWGNCTEATKTLSGSCSRDVECTQYQDCGTCGYQSRKGTVTETGTHTRTTKACEGSGKSIHWTYNDWSDCTYTAATSCTSSKTWGSCTEVNKTLSQTVGCTQYTTDSTACTDTSTACNCGGTKTRTGSRQGSRSGTKTQTRTVDKCEGKGNGRYWTYSNWSDSTSCSGSGSYSYGNCVYTDWGKCSTSACTSSQTCCSNSCQATKETRTLDCGCGGTYQVSVSRECRNGSMVDVGGTPITSCTKSDCSSSQVCCGGGCHTKTSTNVNRGSCASGRGTKYCTVTRSCSNGSIKETEYSCRCSCNSSLTCSGDKEWSGSTCQCEYVSCQYGSNYGSDEYVKCGGRTGDCQKLCANHETSGSCESRCRKGDYTCYGQCTDFCKNKCAYCGSDNRCHRSSYASPH